MAWNDLKSNQMVDESAASTGGFEAAGGPKNPPNKCYTKAEAVAAYYLAVGPLIPYANNQLIPKSVWNAAPP